MNRVIRDIKSSITSPISKVRVDKDSPRLNLRIVESIKKQLENLKSKEELLKEKERLLHEKEAALLERDEALKVREQALKERDDALKDTYTDILTGCLNRNYFEKFIKDNPNPNLNHNHIGFIYADINGLKEINDRHGHKAGDKIIKDTATFFEANFRKNCDKVIRLGGDEFVIVCINIRNNPTFEINLLEKIKRCYQMNPPAKFAYGVAVFNKELDYNLEFAKNRADKAMYQCKKMSKQSLISQSKNKIFDIMSRKPSTRKII